MTAPDTPLSGRATAAGDPATGAPPVASGPGAAGAPPTAGQGLTNRSPETDQIPTWDLLGRQHRLFVGEKRAGWDPENANTFAEEVAHLHEEVSEAFRAFRLTKDYALTLDAAGKPQGVPAELADVVIGIYYIAQRFGFDLDAAVETKHRYNLTRSYEAEGRRLHEQVKRPGEQRS